jgi:hypothetical protein
VVEVTGESERRVQESRRTIRAFAKRGQYRPELPTAPQPQAGLEFANRVSHGLSGCPPAVRMLEQFRWR